MRVATPKQMQTLYRFTLLKFWEVQSPPPPTIEQATEMIGLLFDWSKAKRASGDSDAIKAKVVPLVQRFFPDWDGSDLKDRFFGPRRKYGNSNSSDGNGGNGNGNGHNEQQGSGEPETNGNGPASEPKPEPIAEQEPKPEPDSNKPAGGKPRQPRVEKPEPKPVPAPAGVDPVIADLEQRIKAGLSNFFLHGPAGTGKTTLCKMLAERLNLPCTVLSCNAGTSPGEFKGFQFPEPRPSAVSQAIGVPGIVVLDEITTLDPSVAAVANALLANGEIMTTTGLVKRDSGCIIIATANTLGQGADRQYVGNNQLDAATLDRFTGGYIAVNYNTTYEYANFARDVVEYVHRLRGVIAGNRLRRIASTRLIVACDKLASAGLPWKHTCTETWSKEEKWLV